VTGAIRNNNGGVFLARVTRKGGTVASKVPNTTVLLRFDIPNIRPARVLGFLQQLRW